MLYKLDPVFNITLLPQDSNQVKNDFYKTDALC